MFNLFLSRIRTPFWVSRTGDRFGSWELNSTARVADLFFGRSVSLFVSLISEQTSLVEESLLIWFNSTDS